MILTNLCMHGVWSLGGGILDLDKMLDDVWVGGFT